MLEEDESEDAYVKQETHSPNGVRAKQKRVRVVKRLVERPKSVYERFPAFEKDKILDFSDLFKGYTVRKSRLVKRPFHGKFCGLPSSVMLSSSFHSGNGISS
jgi:transcription initiation factor TFIID subunit 1